MNYQKIGIITAIITLCLTIGLIATPKPAQAFTLFGIHMFEKAKPSVTPTLVPTATPTPKPTVKPTTVVTPKPTVISQNGNLPTTGPEENTAILLLAIIGGFVALKYWRLSHTA